MQTNALFPSFVNDDGEHIFIVGMIRWLNAEDRATFDVTNPYHRRIADDEIAWQDEPFRCFECHQNIVRRNTFGFQYAIYPDQFPCDIYLLPTWMREHLACVPCLLKRIQDADIACSRCGQHFYATYSGSRQAMCDMCRAVTGVDDNERVQRHLKIAKQCNQPATLTLDEWRQAVADFSYLCAYCQKNPYAVLEHFLDVAKAGTTRENCVPACIACNSAKNDRTPEEAACINGFWEEAIERVRGYLAARGAQSLF